MSQPRLLEMMQRLIGAPSISSVSPEWDRSNAEVIDHLADWCETRGFAVERLPIAGHPGKFNLIASAGRGPDGLIMSGHTDTVPFDEARWHSDPLQLCERDGRWYGLGTCDMKGFFAVLLDAIADIDLARLRHPRGERHVRRQGTVGDPTSARSSRGDRRTDRAAAGPPAQGDRDGVDSPNRPLWTFQRSGAGDQRARGHAPGDR